MPDQSRHMQIKRAVMARLAGLDLLWQGGLLNLLILKLPTDRLPTTEEVERDHPENLRGKVEYPMVQISQVSAEIVEQNWGTDTRYNIRWPVQVTIVNRDDIDLLDNDDLYSYWRQQILDAFVSQPLLGEGLSSDIWYCNVEPQWMVNTDAFFNKDMFVSAFVFRFWERRIIEPVLDGPTDPIAV